MKPTLGQRVVFDGIPIKGEGVVFDGIPIKALASPGKRCHPSLGRDVDPMLF